VEMGALSEEKSLVEPQRPDEEVEGEEYASCEEVEWTPNLKLKRISETDVSELPVAYRSNSKKEGLALDYVANFERQYIDLYPYRAPLLLCPLNECGMPKFVCTTVRPTQLTYKQLYDYDKCAAFVADYVTYEPLELPSMLPRHMPSPTSVLKDQAGDCFDLSILLCSLLLGIGYDAYVVVGYAHKKTTRCDQTDRPAAYRASGPAAEGNGGQGSNRYKVQRRPPLESRFLKQQAAEVEVEAANEVAKAHHEAALLLPDEEDEEEMDELRGRRVHAWVLILAGKRELPDDFFVEPSTGVCHRLDESPPFYGVESIFNASNYWVNMQAKEKTSKELSWELSDTSCWEYVFVDSTGASSVDALTLEEGGEEGAEEADTSAHPIAAAPLAVVAAAAAAPAADGEEVVGPPIPRVGSQAALEKPAATVAVAVAVTSVGSAGEEAGVPVESNVGPENILDLPPSWVLKILLTPAQLESKCPGRTKEVPYHRGVLHKWAPYARADGMVSRLTVYHDNKRTQASEVIETFMQRKDRLHKRATNLQANEVVEEFLPGRPFGLRVHELVSGERRRLRFYPGARLDGLQLREETLGKKTIETYVGRDDRLVYRSVTFDPSSASQIVAGAKEAEPVIVKMAEKYARDPSIDAEADVAKRVYSVTAPGFIRALYQFGDGHVTASSRVYPKETWKPLVTLVDPFAKKPLDSALREDFQALVLAERECLQAFREQERQMKDILVKRRGEEAEHQLIISVYDTARSRQYLDADRKEDGASAAVMHDYLTPFLPTPKAGVALTLDRETSLKVRENCLKSLRDRLVERATIIQSRLDEENANLAKKTSTFSRNRDHADKQTEEEYERYCQSAMFRIQIIDERLKRHEKQALQKYEEMDSRLRAEPRMRALMH